MKLRFALPLIAGILGTSSAGADVTFDPKPWVEDLAQARDVFAAKYANLEWAVFDREADLPALFADTKRRIESAQSEADARAAFERLIRRIGDGHVEIHWHAAEAETGGAQLPCSDYNPAMVSAAVTARMAGYAPVASPHADLFPVGVIGIAHHRIGVLRIGLFSPQGYPALCHSALSALSIPADKPCDDACGQRIDDYDNAAFSNAFIQQVEALNAAKPDMLLVDLTRNGGGTEWAEAAVRMLTPARLKSERVKFVRGEHWVKHFRQLESDLRAAAVKEASPTGRARLLAWADEAAAKAKIAATPCDSAPLWEGKRPSCSWLGDAFFMSGILPSADPAALGKKPWAPLVFSPMEFPWREGIWRGPLIVAVDEGTGSASEEFASVLQDNRGALIVGEPTVGVGCGHTDGGTPTTLKNSGAELIVPDCVRVRADGTNENRGVLPDILIGWGRTDGPGLRAADLATVLPGIATTAASQFAKHRRP